MDSSYVIIKMTLSRGSSIKITFIKENFKTSEIYWTIKKYGIAITKASKLAWQFVATCNIFVIIVNNTQFYKTLIFNFLKSQFPFRKIIRQHLSRHLKNCRLWNAGDLKYTFKTNLNRISIDILESIVSIPRHRTLVFLNRQLAFPPSRPSKRFDRQMCWTGGRTFGG